MVVLNTQMQPTHFLRACICWCALGSHYLYTCAHYSLSVCTMWRLQCYARLHHILILLSFSVYTYVYTLTPYLQYYALFLFVYVHTHTPSPSVLYSTRSVPPLCGTLPHLTHLHVRSQVHTYLHLIQTYHITWYGIISSHHLWYYVSSPSVPVTWHAMPLHAP